MVTCWMRNGSIVCVDKSVAEAEAARGFLDTKLNLTSKPNMLIIASIVFPSLTLGSDLPVKNDEVSS